MISIIKGQVLSRDNSSVVLLANDIGYEIQVPMTTLYELPAINSEVLLYTHLAIREDAHVLYGFIRLSDRDLFRQLIKVNGVGPKMALGILSGIEADQLIRVVQHDDLSALVKIPGVGKKTAERLLIELRDKLKPELAGQTQDSINQIPASNAREDAESALLSLGYKAAVASKVIGQVFDPSLSSDELIRLALKSMVTS